jgi:mannose-6-phosphate isomerase-like protein (cupin superfamily)
MKHRFLDSLPFESVSHDPALEKQVLVQRGELPGVRTFSHIVLPPGAAASEHVHEDGFEVFYCIRGRTVFVIDGEAVVVKGSECLVIEPGERHSLEAHEETELVYFLAFK